MNQPTEPWGQWQGHNRRRTIAVFIRCAHDGKEVGYVDADGLTHIADLFKPEAGDMVAVDRCTEHRHDLTDASIGEHYSRWIKTGTRQQLRLKSLNP